MKRSAVRSTLAAGAIALSTQVPGFSAEALPGAESLLPKAMVSTGNQARLQNVFKKAGKFDGAQPKNAGWKSATPGSTIEFEITGEAIFLSFWRINGPMGKARVYIDEGAPIIMAAWFDQTRGGYRNMIQIGKELKAGKHIVLNQEKLR